MSIEQKVEQFAKQIIELHGFRFNEGFSCLIQDKEPFPSNEGLFLWGFSQKRMRFETKVEKFHTSTRIKRMEQMLGLSENEYKKLFSSVEVYLQSLKALGFEEIGKGVTLFGKSKVSNVQADAKFFENNLEALKQFELITIKNPIIEFAENHGYFEVKTRNKLAWDNVFGSHTPGLKASGLKASGLKASAAKTSSSVKASPVKATPVTASSAKASPTKASPVKTTPVKTTPVKATPVKTTPVKATPVKTTPVKASPTKASPVKTTPVKASPTKATPVKATPVKASSTKALPVKAKPVKATPAKATTPAKASPVKATPTKASPVKATPTKASPVKATPVTATPVKAKPVTATPAKASPVTASSAKASPTKASPVKTTPVKASSTKATPVTATPVKASSTKASPVKAKSAASTAKQRRTTADTMPLSEKLQKLAASQPASAIDEKAWNKQVDALYKNVRSWLSEHSKNRYITFNSNKIKLSEANRSEYEINSLELNVVGNHQVIFQPVEMNMPGATGRVDLYRKGYNTQKVMLLLVGPDDKNMQWELWENLNAEPQPFDKKTLEVLLTQWIEY